MSSFKSRKKSGGRSSAGKKYKLTVMDYVTIGFTAVIVLIMIFVLLKSVKPEWFTKKKASPTAVVSDTTPTAEPEPTATAKPAYSGIGTSYGNMSSVSKAAEIDGRVYFAAVDDGGQSGVYVDDGTEVKKLFSDNILTLNVMKDPFTYADFANSVSYAVFYIDADNNICAVTDGPYPASSDVTLPEEPTVTAKTTVVEGGVRSFAIAGDYIYFIDMNGTIGRLSLTENSLDALSRGTYTRLAIYYGTIYALSTDGKIVQLSSNPRPESTETSGEEDGSDAEPESIYDEYEKVIVSSGARAFCVYDDWLYVATDEGIVRYDVDKLGRDTLSKTVIADLINVSDLGIVYAAGNAVYAGSAAQIMTGTAAKLGDTDCSSLSLTSEGVYAYSTADRTMYKFSYDSAAGTFGEKEPLIALSRAISSGT